MYERRETGEFIIGSFYARERRTGRLNDKRA